MAKNGYDDNIQLGDVKRVMEKIRNYAKQSADILDEFDASKLGVAVEKYVDLPKISKEDAQYYLEDLSQMAKENQQDIEKSIDKFKKLYR